MSHGLLSKRYAKALLEHSTQVGDSEALYLYLKKLAKSNALMRIDSLDNPLLSSAQKLSLFLSLTGEEALPPESFIDLVKLLIKNKRELQLRWITLSFISMYRKENKIYVISLTSAQELPAEIVDSICQKVQDRTGGVIEISTHIDPSIEGGFIFKMNDLLLDASVKGQLERFRREFIKNNKIIV